MKKDIEWLKSWFDDDKSYTGEYVKFKINHCRWGDEVEEESLYYALIKGHELSSEVLKYWNCIDYHTGRLIIGWKDPKIRCVNRMTKKNWDALGINGSNADFIKVDEELN